MDYQYWVYVEKHTYTHLPFWKGFNSKIAALLFMKVYGCKLLAVRK